MKNFLVTVPLLLACSALAHAGVILTFDLTDPGNIAMNPAYGNRVAAAIDAAGMYGTFGSGFTPNVTVSYGGGSFATYLVRWTTDYGDLVNVLENELDFDDRLTITLTADPGYLVRLYSFDLAGWPNADYTLNNVFVKDAANANLFSASNVLVKGAMNAGHDPRHTSFAFDPLVGSTLQIYIDLSGLGGNSDNIGIDNIAFDQVKVDTPGPGPAPIPEPSTWLSLGAGLAALIAARRRS
jgi:hypothetical protein